MENIKNIFYNQIKNAPSENIIKEIRIDWTQHAIGIHNIAKSICSEFQIDNRNRTILKLMLLYFSGSQMFADELKAATGSDGSLNKGLMIVGGVGTGKSLLFKIFKEYTREIIYANSFKYYNSVDIIDNCNVSGTKYLEMFSNNFDNNSPKPMVCYIDDIASKNETVKHFGTELNVIEQLLSLRYNVFQRYGKLTHCTSNKYPTELDKIYDIRIGDRIKEMFNIIELSGDSFRK